MLDNLKPKRLNKHSDDTIKTALQLMLDGKTNEEVVDATGVNINTLGAWRSDMKKPGTRPARMLDEMQGVLRIEVTAAEKVTAFRTFQERISRMAPNEAPSEKGRLAILALKFA